MSLINLLIQVKIKLLNSQDVPSLLPFCIEILQHLWRGGLVLVRLKTNHQRTKLVYVNTKKVLWEAF